MEPDDDKLTRISKSYPIPNGRKMNTQLDTLEGLAEFYESKLPTAPDKLRTTFSKYITSLNYAMTIILMYRNLTAKIAATDKEDHRDSETTETY